MINPATSPRFITIEELVKGMLRREKDLTGIDKLLYKSVAKDIYKELNLASIKVPIRLWMNVDKRTNSITLPDNFMNFSSIEIEECGVRVPVIINTNLLSDIVDVSNIPDCGCDCGCQSETCSSIKNYELIQEEISIIMPDSTVKVFTETTRKKLNKDGTIVIETIKPVQQFDNGTYVGVVMETNDEFFCHVEVLPCGCVAQTKENDDICYSCTAAISFGVDCGCNITPDHLMRKHHDERYRHPEYNFSQEGDRIIFHHPFHYDRVLISYYANTKTKDILLPIIAMRAMVAGIKADMEPYDKRAVKWKADSWEDKYIRAKRVLMDQLNPINITKFNTQITPHRRMV